MARHLSPDPVFTVMFVCTGNICRSAMAQGLARAYLADALGTRATWIEVVSAGTRAVRGSGVHPDSATVLTSFGGDPAGHVARQLIDDMAIDADLILAMTRQHRRAVLSAAPRALQRAFTLHEAAEVLALLPDDLPLRGLDPASRGRALVTAMAVARARRPAGRSDDVADPIEGPLKAHHEAMEDIVRSLVPILQRLVDLRGTTGAPTERVVSAADRDS